MLLLASFSALRTTRLPCLVSSQGRPLPRNRPDGCWVAAADPNAAQHAHVESYPRSDMKRASAFTDGATRPVDQMVATSGVLTSTCSTNLDRLV